MKKILAVCGPTASGKTALAVECAKLLDGEIISCDALLVYRGLDIGTAKPSLAERQGIPHYMIDAVSPFEKFSVSDFERMAMPVLEDILARGKTPILCGGTGFYMNALLFPSSFGAVPASEEIRQKYERIERKKGREYLHGLLREADEASAEKLHFNDVKRVIRALEIYELTGRKKSDQNDGYTPRFPYLAVSFDFEREALYRRIEARVEEMFANGLVAEVEALLKSGVPYTAQCMQGIGYKEGVEGLKNGDSNSTTRDVIAKNTRNYAKRQLTFFKKLPVLYMITPQDPEAAAREVMRKYES